MEVLFLPSSTLMQRGSALVEERKQAVREEQRKGYGGPVRGQRVHAPWAHRPLRPADEKRLRALEHPGPTGPYPQGGPGTLLGRPPLVGRGRKKKMSSRHAPLSASQVMEAVYQHHPGHLSQPRGGARRRRRRVLVDGTEGDAGAEVGQQEDPQVMPIKVQVLPRQEAGSPPPSPRVRIMHPQEPGSPAGLVADRPPSRKHPQEAWGENQQQRQHDGVSHISKASSSSAPSLEAQEEVRLLSESGEPWNSERHGDPPVPEQYRERSREQFRKEVTEPLEHDMGESGAAQLEASFEVIAEEEEEEEEEEEREERRRPRRDRGQLFGKRDVPLFRTERLTDRAQGKGGRRRDTGLDTSADRWFLGKYHLEGGPPRAVLQVPPARVDADKLEREDDVILAPPRYTRGGYDGKGFLSRPAEASVVERMETTVEDMSESRHYREARGSFVGSGGGGGDKSSRSTSRSHPTSRGMHARPFADEPSSHVAFDANQEEDDDPLSFHHVVQSVHDSFVSEDGEALNPQQRDQLFLQSCEGILEHLRRQERNLLARKRTEEFQDQRGPMPNWWEIKDTRFSSEVHRNNRSLSQSWHEVEGYLDELMQPVAF